MSYLYPAEPLLQQWGPISSASPSSYGHNGIWVPLDTTQDSSPDFDYLKDVPWEEVDSQIYSTTNLSFNSVARHNASYAGYPANSSTMSQTSGSDTQGSPEYTISMRESVGDSKVKRRREQNRISQRAFRERMRRREEEMAATIFQLESELERLRSKDKLSTEKIQTLSKEIIRLRGISYALQ